jgi:hypothetical protein
VNLPNKKIDNPFLPCAQKLNVLLFVCSRRMSEECSIMLDQSLIAVEQPGSDAGSSSAGLDNQPASPEDYIRQLAAERSALELQSPGCALALRLISQGRMTIFCYLEGTPKNLRT